MLMYFWFFSLFLKFLVSKPCFLSFSMQNHAESSRIFVKKPIFEFRTCRIEQKLWFRSWSMCFSAGLGRSSPIWVRPDSGDRPKSEFGRIRTAVPNLSSAGFERPSQIRVRPDSDGRAGSAGFGRTSESKPFVPGCGNFRWFLKVEVVSIGRFPSMGSFSLHHVIIKLKNLNQVILIRISSI